MCRWYQTGRIIPVFKDSITFQVDLKELEKFFVLFFFPNNIKRIHCGEDVDHISCEDKNMHNKEKSTLETVKCIRMIQYS